MKAGQALHGFIAYSSRHLSHIGANCDVLPPHGKYIITKSHSLTSKGFRSASVDIPANLARFRSTPAVAVQLWKVWNALSYDDNYDIRS